MNMLSRLAGKWKWYDWIVLLFAVVAICFLLQKALPDAGLTQALHAGFHVLAIGVGWIANGLTAFAVLLEQL